MYSVRYDLSFTGFVWWCKDFLCEGDSVERIQAWFPLFQTFPTFSLVLFTIRISLNKVFFCGLLFVLFFASQAAKKLPPYPLTGGCCAVPAAWEEEFKAGKTFFSSSFILIYNQYSHRKISLDTFTIFIIKYEVVMKTKSAFYWH